MLDVLGKRWMEARVIDPPSPLAMLKENEAILKTRSDVVKNKERDNKKLWESCVGTKCDCCKIVIIGIKCEYLSYRHFNWRILFLEAKNFWNVAILKLLSRLFICFVLFFFFKIFINIDGREGGRLACTVLVLREAVKSSAVNHPNTCD